MTTIGNTFWRLLTPIHRSSMTLLHFCVKTVKMTRSFPKQVTNQSEMSDLTEFVRSIIKNMKNWWISWKTDKFHVLTTLTWLWLDFGHVLTTVFDKFHDFRWFSWLFPFSVFRNDDFSTGLRVVGAQCHYPEVYHTHYPGHVPPTTRRSTSMHRTRHPCLSSGDQFARLLLVTTWDRSDPFMLFYV